MIVVPVWFLLAVLCADRVGQMTKTYSDIDAVTRLLEEVRGCAVLATRAVTVLRLSEKPSHNGIGILMSFFSLRVTCMYDQVRFIIKQTTRGH